MKMDYIYQYTTITTVHEHIAITWTHKHVYQIKWITQVGTHLHYMNHNVIELLYVDLQHFIN